MKTLIDLFNTGMMRNYDDIIPSVDGCVLNLGAGNKLIDGSIPLQLPEWNAEIEPIPYGDCSVSMIHAYHFLEHIENVPFVISECLRVLKFGGHMNIVVPYYKSQMAFQDLDHKTFYTENTFRTLFDNSYYSKDKVIGFSIKTNMIMGDSERTMCLVVQLVKVGS